MCPKQSWAPGHRSERLSPSNEAHQLGQDDWDQAISNVDIPYISTSVKTAACGETAIEQVETHNALYPAATCHAGHLYGFDVNLKLMISFMGKARQ